MGRPWLRYTVQHLEHLENFSTLNLHGVVGILRAPKAELAHATPELQ